VSHARVAYTLAERLSYFRNAVLTTVNAAVQVKVEPMPFAIYSIASEGSVHGMGICAVTELDPNMEA
jgi:hypothetical protein